MTSGDLPTTPLSNTLFKRQPPPSRNRDTTRIERTRNEHQGEHVLDERTVLVVDEAGMLGSRKLARLLDHAQDAGAKVVLVGDDKQLASIDAGGGFRGLRLRLGASTLSETAARPSRGSARRSSTCATATSTPP